MSIFNFLTLVGGLALTLYGMNVMGNGLTRTSGGKLGTYLVKLSKFELSQGDSQKISILLHSIGDIER